MYDEPHTETKHLPAYLAQWANFVYAGSLCYNVSKVILFAILDHESKGGITILPPGPCGKSECGKKFGLMQIDGLTNQAFIVTGLWKDPAQNIFYASMLLSHYLEEFQGDYAAAIGAYNVGPVIIRSILHGAHNHDPVDQRVALIDSVTKNQYVTNIFTKRDGLYKLVTNHR